MKLSSRAEEILETLWIHSEEEKGKIMELGIAKGEPEIDELYESGNIKLTDDKIVLTENGKKTGERVVRRHRLAERLFVDILDVKKKFVHTISCQFEHLIQEGIEENICTLLGLST